MKSQSWDSLKNNCEMLSQTEQGGNNALSKSIQSGKLGEEITVEEVQRYLGVMERLGGMIYEQFVQLRADYQQGSINLQVYRSYLNYIKKMLIGDRDNVMHVKSLNIPVIVEELKKHFVN